MARPLPDHSSNHSPPAPFTPGSLALMFLRLIRPPQGPCTSLCLECSSPLIFSQLPPSCSQSGLCSHPHLLRETSTHTPSLHLQNPFSVIAIGSVPSTEMSLKSFFNLLTCLLCLSPITRIYTPWSQRMSSLGFTTAPLVPRRVPGTWSMSGRLTNE